MEIKTPPLKYVDNGWDEAYASRLSPLERLVYRSNLLGSDWRITNTGGGNTSSKLTEKDPLTGETVRVLWVKGSGGDLRTARAANFASLYQDRLEALQDVYATYPQRGVKSEAEDAMVEKYRHCTFDLNPRAPSIDTPLHAFVPYAHVDHTHPVACIAVATAAAGPELTQEIYGEEVAWLDWQRPGFELGLALQELCESRPNARGAILGGHGLINWADHDRECYLLSLSLIDKAEAYIAERLTDPAHGGRKYEILSVPDREAALTRILPWLRGRLSRPKRMIATVEYDGAVLEFASSVDAARLAELGTSCPDHFLRTKIKPLYVDWDPQGQDIDALKDAIDSGLATYGRDYAAYYEAHRRPGSPAMRGGLPTVILIPGLGMMAWGKSKSESRVTAEFYKAAIEVMRGADSISSYTALPRQEAFDIEYWRLEEAKLKRMPPEAELSRRVIAVVGAGNGIGREVVPRLLDEGAVVAAVDMVEGAVHELVDGEMSRRGTGIGVAGSGISGSGDAIAVSCDVTDRSAVRKALDRITLAYGGLDSIAITAGRYVSPDVNGRIGDDEWASTFEVNAFGPYVVADEARSLWKEQALTGSLVVTTSVNAIVAKRGSLAYDTSKAAANHLIRELAVELAPLIRVNGLAPATVLDGSTMFPRDRIIASLAKYDLGFDESEETEVLRDRLANFYAGRTLTGRTVTMTDQAEALFLLLGDRLSKTTGQILTVDGGLAGAFLR